MNTWWRRLAAATLTGTLSLIAGGYIGNSTAAGATPAAMMANLSPSISLSQPSTGVPAELVGTWVSTDSGNAEMVYRFLSDGRYRHAGVLLQQRPSGQFSYEIAATGTMQVVGSRLVLQPTSGTQTLKDPDSPTGGWQRPIKNDPEPYTWQLSSANVLALTDSEGNTITYRRE
jgi:hypothetical protein